MVGPHQRIEHFGQWDHIRYYGIDIKERLKRAGFTVHQFVMLDILNLSTRDIKAMNLNKREIIFDCRKP